MEGLSAILKVLKMPSIARRMQEKIPVGIMSDSLAKRMVLPVCIKAAGHARECVEIRHSAQMQGTIMSDLLRGLPWGATPQQKHLDSSHRPEQVLAFWGILDFCQTDLE